MTGRRGAALLVVATLVALVAGHLLRDTPGYARRGEDGQYLGDIDHYVYWTRLVTLGGIQDAYSGTWPETYAVYPPVTLYPYQVVGNVYRLLQDQTFDEAAALESPWLRQAIKAVALGWHLLAGAAIYLVLSGRLVRLFPGTGTGSSAGRRWAAPAAALYLANPAALFDVAHWGQPDGAHSLFGVLTIGLVQLGAIVPGWASLGLAALAKPQAWAIGPLIVLATWQVGGAQAVARGAVAGAAVAALVLLPFLVTGRLGEFLSLPGTIAGVMPVVTADAHNVWWLYFRSLGEDPLYSNDAAPLVGRLTFRMVAGLLVGAQFLATYWLYLTRRASLPEAASLGMLGWFLFTTQAHENHMLFALPLLALAWPERPRLLIPFAVLSGTVLLNMALHDLVLLEWLGLALDDAGVSRLRSLNALANLTCFTVWMVAALLRPSAGYDGDPPGAAAAGR